MHEVKYGTPRIFSRAKPISTEILAFLLTFSGWRWTRLSTTGTRDAAATALTSSSKSCSPSVIAGKTLGSNVSIRSYKSKIC